jgi:hypothetical protein
VDFAVVGMGGVAIAGGVVAGGVRVDLAAFDVLGPALVADGLEQGPL